MQPATVFGTSRAIAQNTAVVDAMHPMMEPGARQSKPPNVQRIPQDVSRAESSSYCYSAELIDIPGLPLIAYVHGPRRDGAQ